MTVKLVAATLMVPGIVLAAFMIVVRYLRWRGTAAETPIGTARLPSLSSSAP